MLPMRFTSLHDLARLPWFELRDGGRLAVADPSVGPVVDVHTHFALSYGLPPSVDLQRSTPRTEHYLPAERPLDLEPYGNRNFTAEDLRRLKRDLTLASLTAGGMRATHTVPNLAREMAELGVARSCILPIDFPVLSRNAETKLAAIAGRSEFIGFGSVHPWARDVEGKLDRQVALGARGVKVHPAVQMVGPESPRAMHLYRLCAQRKLPVLWHCGPVDIETRLGRRLSQVRRYSKPIERNPETTFILGHAGALQMPEALELAKRHANVWLDVSCQGVAGVRRILDEADPGRILFGSDWPFYHQAIGLAKVLIATEDRRELRAKLLHLNAERLFGPGRADG
jgi:predicted TIM-barrel fold metal-dependent hydrolase